MGTDAGGQMDLGLQSSGTTFVLPEGCVLARGSFRKLVLGTDIYSHKALECSCHDEILNDTVVG